MRRLGVSKIDFPAYFIVFRSTFPGPSAFRWPSIVMDIIHVKTPHEIHEIRRLFREYEAYLNVDLCFQQFESELANLPGKYAPPSGTLLLAIDGRKACGCGALRRFGPIQDRMCEMKRLYVCPEARGLGVGKQIARRLIQEGACLGYSTMVLDTIDSLGPAIHLYESLGFVRTDPYYDNPLSGVVYLKLELRGHHNIKKRLDMGYCIVYILKCKL